MKFVRKSQSAQFSEEEIKFLNNFKNLDQFLAFSEAFGNLSNKLANFSTSDDPSWKGRAVGLTAGGLTGGALGTILGGIGGAVISPENTLIGAGLGGLAGSALGGYTGYKLGNKADKEFDEEGDVIAIRQKLLKKVMAGTATSKEVAQLQALDSVLRTKRQAAVGGVGLAGLALK